jgi:alkanesulfonate monooxygenase SsuD/methylene tetrahydromethanopterin reductase-like flavin-dependent oxidoreductase (luciferase family)
MINRLEELGFYTLAGQAKHPRVLIDEMQQAEQAGLGHCFISERWNTKEAATISGAVGAVSSSISIATAATNHTTRHPILTAAYATTMHRLTGGRFTLGIGRGVKPLHDSVGLPPITTSHMEDFAHVIRRLFRGETVVDHDGPIGRYPALRLDPDFNEDIPLGIVAFGPATLTLVGRAFDQVVLHTFFTDETSDRQKARTRERLVDAARTVFTRDGFYESQIASIPAEAGMATGTFYNYFESKEDIFQALMSTVVAELTQLPDALEDSRLGLVATIRRANRAYLHGYRRNAQLIKTFVFLADGNGQIVSSSNSSTESSKSAKWQRLPAGSSKAWSRTASTLDIPPTRIPTWSTGSQRSCICSANPTTRTPRSMSSPTSGSMR